MPHSKRIVFTGSKLPDNLRDEDYVFYCAPTREAFMTYREYCERIIQCNSLIWTDSVSGKGDFTYTEALESEAKSWAVLSILPPTLHIPVLYLASIAQNEYFEELVLDVFYFVEDHYFLGETVHFLTFTDDDGDDDWKEGVVTKVIPPSPKEIEVLKNKARLIDRCDFFPPSTSFLYEVECSDGSGNKSTVAIPYLRRPPETWTEEKATSFLKYFIVLRDGSWFLDKGVMRTFKIPYVKFRDFYAGYPPVFPVQCFNKEYNRNALVKNTTKNVQNGFSEKCDEQTRNKKSDRLLTKQDRKRLKKLSKDGTINKNQSSSLEKGEKLQQTDIKTFFKSACNQGVKLKSDGALESFGQSDANVCDNKCTESDTEDISLVSEDVTPVAVPGPSSTGSSTMSKRLRVRGPFSKKGKQLRITGDGKLEGMEAMSKHSAKMRRKESTNEKDREVEKLRREKKEQAVLEGFRLHAERLRIKAKQEEDKLQFAKFMKEWRKKREDLECEDLKPLPVPHQINWSIPNHLFGDFVMILEFLNSFHDFLKMKSYIPGGISLDLLERALIETEIAGPLHDILSMFLNSIFECQVAENEMAKTNGISVDISLDELYSRKMTSKETGKNCLDATGWCETFQGVSIQELDLTPLSVSEILRLHLLGSGGRSRDFSQWLRQRPTSFDDPIYWLRTEHASVLIRLSQQHVCELPVEEKLTILTCLMNEILAYTQVRDLLDDRGEQMRAAKAEVRTLEIAELKMQKEATAKRIQNKRTAKLLRLKGESSGKSNTLLLKHQKDAEMEKLKIEKEISKLRTEIQKKQNKVLPLVMTHQLHPIGSDRAHRYFWLFSSVPGLFVEYSPFELGPCLPKPTPLRTEDRGDIESHVRKLFELGQNCSSDKENDTSDGELAKPPSSPNKKKLAEQNISVDLSSMEHNEKELPRELEESDVPLFEFLICTANNKCPVHCQSISRSNWSFFSNPSDVEKLLESLNERGIRESDLKRAMMREQERIKESIMSCPFQKLSSKFAGQEPRKSTRNSGCYKPEVANLDFPSGTPIMKIMESVLRDSILEMENKITLGCLGVLKVQDRSAWRLAIEKGDYDQQCEELAWGFSKSCPEKDSEHFKSIKEEMDVESVIKEDEMDVESVSQVERPSVSPNELYLGVDNQKWSGSDSESDVNMINMEEGEQGGEEEVCSSNEYNENERESPAHSCSNSDVVSYTEEPDNYILHEKLAGRGDHETGETDGQNSLFADDFNEPTKIEVSSSVQKDKMEVEDNTKITSEVSPTNQIKNLARAILQLGQSVDPKFLLKPLADDDGQESRLQIKYWEASLMNAVNFSQLFIHQFTLDRSIHWSKSILRMPCRICRRRGEPETMISCSKCQKRYHYKCTNTKDSEIHKESWQCPICSKEYVPKSSKSKKRKNYFVKSRRNEAIGNSAPERKLARLVCQKCGISGENLVSCASCPKTFHANCLNPHPRLHHLYCDICKPTENSNSSDAESQYSVHGDSDEAPGRERRVCASATIAKIASFAKRLRSCSWDEEDADDVTSVGSTSSRENGYSSHQGHESPIRRSSRRAEFISESLPLDNAVLQHLLDEMIHHEDSWPFLRPVRKSEVPDYHLYIKKPMDLGTIKYKLNTAEYKNNYDFVVDTLLVFENCFMYNSSQTAVYKCGVEMLKFFKRRCKELGLMEYEETLES